MGSLYPYNTGSLTACRCRRSGAVSFVHLTKVIWAREYGHCYGSHNNGGGRGVRADII